MTDKKSYAVNVISKRMRHHATASGYDRLADFLGAHVIHPVSHWTFGKRLATRTLRFLIKGSGSRWYQRDSFYSELCAGWHWLLGKGQIFHFLYGENSYRYLGLLKLKGHRNFIICTYHTPPEKFKVVVHERSHLGLVDAVIVLSASQMDFFSDLLGPERVFYVPHGIDVDFYRPKERESAPGVQFRCLFVGSHLRDFATLAQANQLLIRSGKDFRLSVVTPMKFHDYFRGMNNVELHAGISDEKLLALYQESDVFVFPLLRSTANNSILEAMACGLPVICTDLTATREYCNDSCAIFTAKGDPEALAEAVMYLLEDEVCRQRMARESRNNSLTFSWQKVASEVQKVYEQVLF